MNNPADTLAALAPCPFCGHHAKLIESAEAPGKYGSPSWKVECDFPFRPCVGGFINLWMQTPEEAIAAWNRRASLKGEAEPVAWQGRNLPNGPWTELSEKTFNDLKSREITGIELRALYTTPPAPQAVVEVTEARVEAALAVLGLRANRKDDVRAALRVALSTPSPDPQADKDLMQRTVDKVVSKVMGQREEILQAFVAKYGFQPDEAVQVVGADGSWRVMRRQDMSTPSPAPQGGGEVGRCQHQHTVTVNGPSAATSSGIGCLVTGGRCLPGSCAECPATPPAQQPGEVGGVRVTHQMILRAQAAVPSRGNAPAIYYSETQAILEAALAPKEKGNGPPLD